MASSKKYSYRFYSPDKPTLTDDELKVSRWFYLMRGRYGIKAPSAALAAAVEYYAQTGGVPDLGRVCADVKDYEPGVGNWTIRVREGSSADKILSRMVERSELRFFITSLISEGLEEVGLGHEESVSPVHSILALLNGQTAEIKPNVVETAVKETAKETTSKPQKKQGISSLFGSGDLGEVKLKMPD